MCKKCGFSGCRHDWERWNPNEYHRGYNDYIKNPQTEMIDRNSAYNTGLISAKSENESYMVLYPFERENDDLNLEWISEDNRFNIIFDENTCKWFYVEKGKKYTCGEIKRELLEKIYGKIANILGK